MTPPIASAGLAGPNFMPLLLFLCGSRSCAVISAMIATAISDGETAPIGRPIGAWMRAMSVSFAPCAFSRSARLAWVFREPSAPI